MQKYADVVMDRKGNVVPGATVQVKTSAGTNAELFAGNGTTPTNNPLITDDFGRFAFYAANGRYNLQVFIGNTLLTTSVDILLEDPLDKTVEVIKGGTIEDVALSNITIDGKAPGFKVDTDALGVRAAALETGAAATGVRVTALETTTTNLDTRLDALEGSSGGVPPGLESRLVEIETDAAALDVRVDSLAATALPDAPSNDKTYARKNHAWVALPPGTEYWDASVYLADVELGPSNRLVELYPRLNLSRPVLPSCFVRRAVPASENLTLLLKPTSGTDWTATCIIPAGQREGFFTSGSVLPVDSTQGIYITPSPLPTEAVTGLSITLRFEIEVEQTVSLLSVPQPAPLDTLILFGTSASPSPSFFLRDMNTNGMVGAVDASANIPNYQSASLSRDGKVFLYCKANGNLVGADALTGETKFSKVDAVVRKGASGNKDANKVLTAELRSGVWWAVSYNTPTMTVFQEVNLSTYGVTNLNAIRYSSNDRYIMVGHDAGSLVLNSLTLAVLNLTTPPTGNVLDVDVTPSIYAIMSRKATDFTLHITTNGQLMTRTGTTVWNNITCNAFNWFTDVPSPYPYFVVAGQTSAGWQVVPYSASDFAYQEMPWRINFGEPIVAVAFSEAVTLDEQVTESAYGRALVVFGQHGYKIYDLLTGAEVAAQTIANYSTVTGGLWKWVPGVLA